MVVNISDEASQVYAVFERESIRGFLATSPTELRNWKPGWLWRLAKPTVTSEIRCRLVWLEPYDVDDFFADPDTVNDLHGLAFTYKGTHYRLREVPALDELNVVKEHFTDWP